MANVVIKPIDAMVFKIRHEYETEELSKYNPKKFEDYLLKKLAEIRLEQGLWELK